MRTRHYSAPGTESDRRFRIHYVRENRSIIYKDDYRKTIESARRVAISKIRVEGYDLDLSPGVAIIETTISIPQAGYSPTWDEYETIRADELSPKETN